MAGRERPETVGSILKFAIGCFVVYFVVAMALTAVGYGHVLDSDSGFLLACLVLIGVVYARRKKRADS